jgi:catechol 1,2-dioxygenase
MNLVRRSTCNSNALALAVAVALLSNCSGSSDDVDDTSFTDVSQDMMLEDLLPVGLDSGADFVDSASDDDTVTAKDVGPPETAMEDVSPPETTTEDVGPPETATEDLGPVVCQVTSSDAQGPYYVEGAPFKNPISDPDEPGTRLVLSGTVSGTDCAGISEAVVDVWQTDAAGLYPSKDEGFRLRGKVAADENGVYTFETVLPGFYEGRPRHVHIKVSGASFVGLTTQVYFEGDPYLWPVDSCGPPTCHSDDPKRIVPLHSELVDGVEKQVGTLNLVLNEQPM